MSLFTARKRHNAFAERKKREAEEAAAAAAAAAETEAATAATAPEAETETPAAVPYDTRDDASTDIVDVPDVSTFATGGVVEQPQTLLTEDEAEHYVEQVSALADSMAVPVEMVISAETRAKVDAVLNHEIAPAESTEGTLTLDDAANAPEGWNSADLGGVTGVEETPEPKRGRGRPRPQETIDRDNAVHAMLVGADPETGISKESLAAELREKEQQVYSSLRQLTKEGRAETRYVKPHGYRWFAL